MKIKVNFKEKCCSSHLEISASCTIQNAITLQYLNISYSALLSVKCSFTGGKTQRQFQTLSSESGHVSFYEVPNTMIWLKFLVFWKTGRWGEEVAYESWSQPVVRVYERF